MKGCLELKGARGMYKIRACFLSLWNLFDPLYYFLSRLSYVDKQNHQNGVFRVRLTKYRGKDLCLEDGTSICKNDLLLKIHLHNAKLLKDMYKLDNDFRKGLYLYNQIKRALPGLSTFIANHPDHEKIKAIFGVTMLHQGSERLGFEIYPILNTYYLHFKQIVQFPIYFLATVKPNQKKRVRPMPKYLFMTKTALHTKFGK